MTLPVINAPAIVRYRCDCGRTFPASEADERHEFLPEEFWGDSGSNGSYLVCPYCAADDIQEYVPCVGCDQQPLPGGDLCQHCEEDV